jgi:hypothetical protein
MELFINGCTSFCVIYTNNIINYLPISVSIIEELTYATSIITKLAMIASGLDFFGLWASSPVVAMMSNPIKA